MQLSVQDKAVIRAIILQNTQAYASTADAVIALLNQAGTSGGGNVTAAAALVSGQIVVGGGGVAIGTSAVAVASLAPLNSPTFTGTVVLPATTSIGTVSNTEIAFLDGVTSSIQGQIDAKASLNSPTFTGAPTLPTGTIAVTQLTGDNDTSVATTAFVQQELAAFTPTGVLKADGSVAGATIAAQDFGTLGIKVDILTESTASAGVSMPNGVKLKFGTDSNITNTGAGLIATLKAGGELDISDGVGGSAYSIEGTRGGTDIIVVTTPTGTLTITNRGGLYISAV